MNKNITFVCSYICGGKSFIGKILAKNTNATYIEISNVVKKILKKEARNDINNKPELDEKIIEELKKLTTNNKNYIIAGVRQVSILEAFKNSTKIWITTSHEERFHRFQKRFDENEKDGLIKTIEVFQNYNELDEKLGIDEVKNYIFKNN